MQKTQDIDFKDLAIHSLRFITDLVPGWLPGGRMQGGEWCCGSKMGGPGDSMRVNMSSGLWADFATDDKGGDLISLLACIGNIKQIEAAKDLANKLNYGGSGALSYSPPSKPTEQQDRLIKPPANLDPDLQHFKLGSPSMSWVYRDKDGDALFWIARYDVQGKGKEFFPWSYSEKQKRLIMKGWPEPRPLYNLDKLYANPNKPVLIVEGEKAAVGAERLGAEQNYIVTTWPNGSKSWRKADWSVLAGRNILIWPDADEPGLSAGSGIAQILCDVARQVKIIHPDQSDGWDAWDAFQEEKSWADIVKWAKDRVSVSSKKEDAPLLVEERALAKTPEPDAVQEAEIVEPEPANPPDIKAEITHKIEDVAPPVSSPLLAKFRAYGVALNLNDRPHPSISNIAKIFSCDEYFKGHIWHDKFDYRAYSDLFGGLREVSDADILKLTAMIQREWGMHTIKSQLVHEAVDLVAHLNPRHSIQQWINGIKWDGKPRVKTFFPDYLGADKNAYTEAVSSNFWVGMVARVFQPGCKNDYMVVLEGPQGVGKSMALGAIGGKWHTESTEAFGSKDFFQGLHGKLIVEIAELDSFSRAEVTRVKQVVSAQADRFRSSYGRTASDYPRQCVFVGTTNEFGYLRDATGARRFWPIKCGKIFVDKIRADREQLFAESRLLHENGTKWHVVPAGMALMEQEARFQHDELDISVVEYIRGKDYIIMRDMAKESMNIDESRFDKRIQVRLGSILRRRGWEPRRETVGGEQTRVWAPIGSPRMVVQSVFGPNGSAESSAVPFGEPGT